ncbi:MAG TPA: hypothetical protein VD913_06070 [bacterium]|nr:hypothetical protein [bacterium]
MKSSLLESVTMSGDPGQFLVSGPWPSKRQGHYLRIDPFFEREERLTSACRLCSLAPQIWSGNCGIHFKPAAKLIGEIREELKSYTRIDIPVESLIVESFWEPTCHPGFSDFSGALIALKKEFFPLSKLGILSNGSQAFRQEIRETFEMFDFCWMRLDAGHSERHDLSDFEAMVNAFRKMRRNTVIRSVFVQGEIDNTHPETIDHWIETVGFIQPREVQITTMEEKASGQGMQRVEDKRLHEIQENCQSMTGVPVFLF